MALQEELEVQGNYLFKYRSNLPLLIVAMGLIVYIIPKMYPGTFEVHYNTEWYKYICLAVCFLGLIIRIYTVGHTPKNTSGRNTSEGQVADELNTSGIYSTVRHPLYVGNFFMWLGVAMLTYNLWFNVAFVFMYWVYYERIMFAEEQFLRGKFGQKYLDWAAGVPAFWISIKNFRKAKMPFSWKKILRQEKNGLVAIFILFYAFELIDMYFKHGEFVLTYDFWFISFAFTMVLYLVLKFLKRKTRILHETGR